MENGGYSPSVSKIARQWPPPRPPPDFSPPPVAKRNHNDLDTTTSTIVNDSSIADPSNVAVTIPGGAPRGSSLRRSNREIRQRQESLTRRKNEVRENNILRDSQRASKKLMKLRKDAQARRDLAAAEAADRKGIENIAFIDDGSSDNILSRFALQGDEDNAAIVASLKSHLTSGQLRDWLAVYSALSRQGPSAPIRTDASVIATRLLDEYQSSCPPELSKIMDSPGFKSFLQSHDHVASLITSRRNLQKDPSDPERVLSPGAVSSGTPPSSSLSGALSPAASTPWSPKQDKKPDSDRFGSDAEEDYEGDRLSDAVAPDDMAILERKRHEYDVPATHDVKFVTWTKTSDDDFLGVTIRNTENSIIVTRVLRNGRAFKDKLIDCEDEILEIAGISVQGRTIDDVCEMLARQTGTIKMLIVPNPSPIINPHGSVLSEVCHVRALFSYDPSNDTLCPCKELGLSFNRGDILHILSTEESNWWQAYREGETDAVCGIIPSKEFWESCERLRLKLERDAEEMERANRGCCPAFRASKHNEYGSDDFQDDILTYEFVGEYRPEPLRKRPIVLVGPDFIGLSQLRLRLLESDRFARPVPHTTRPPGPKEQPGIDFHFVSNDHFQRMLDNQEFAEYAEHNRHFFGTSLKSIRTEINREKIVVLCVRADCLAEFRSKSLMPFIIFVQPPNMITLRELQHSNGAPMNDEQMERVIQEGRQIDIEQGHWFDEIVCVRNLDYAWKEISKILHRVENEKQWVPIQWTSNHFQTTFIR